MVNSLFGEARTGRANGLLNTAINSRPATQQGARPNGNQAPTSHLPLTFIEQHEVWKKLMDKGILKTTGDIYKQM